MSLLIENTEERSLYTPFRADFLQGVTSWRLWLFLGVYEVRRRYRRTIIGPFWNTISLAVFVFVVGWIGAGLWREDVGGITHLTFDASTNKLTQGDVTQDYGHWNLVANRRKGCSKSRPPLTANTELTCRHQDASAPVPDH